MGLRANNNQTAIKRLAKNSIRNGKMRNFFVVFTIVLSVSLLIVMALVQSGYKIATQRIVDKMQHVIYMEVSEEAIQKLSESEQVSYLALLKDGQSIEEDGKLIQVAYRQFEPTLGNASDIKGYQLLEGEEPEAMNEVAVSEAYLKRKNINPQIGVSFDITFLDGTTEHVTVSGLIDVKESAKTYPILFSKAYAEEGAQLTTYPYQAIVRIQDAREMKQETFLNAIRELAQECGIVRRHVNENNYFVNLLPGGKHEIRDTLIYLGVGIGILFVSVLVIYSVFYLSVVGRVRQFGQLRTIGMTKKQVRTLIFREGLLLSGIGIPIGTAIGCIVGYLIQPDGWDWKNVCGIIVIVSVADVLTVLLSIYKPAKTASAIAPVEAAKFNGYQSDNIRKETKCLRRKLTPVSLACMSAKRNKKKTMLTIISLGVGGILFMLAATYAMSTSLEEYARSDSFRDGEFILSFSNNAMETHPHGMAGIQLNNPFNEELEETILAIEGVKEIFKNEYISVKWEANGDTLTDTIAPIKRNEAEQYLTGNESTNYDQMIKNNEILISNKELVKEIVGWEFQIGDELIVYADNGQEEVTHTFTVGGFVENDNMEHFANPGLLFLPEDTLHKMMNGINLISEIVVKTEEKERSQIEQELKKIVESQPVIRLATLEAEMTVVEEQFATIFAVILGLSIFIIGFSIINMTNTIITNILARKQEFAMLQSIGMSAVQLKRMVNTEGLLLAAGNLGVTLTVGTLAGIGEIVLLQKIGATYMHYKFPIWFVAGYTILIIGVPLLISKVAVNNFQKQSLVERLRETEG